MRRVELLCIGDLKFKALEELEKKYLQNINFFVKFSVKKLRESKLKDERMIREKEGEVIEKALARGDYVVALDRRGVKMNSEQFAHFLEEKIAYHAGRIVFLIGGFAGLSPALLQTCQARISFSDMTFAHDIFRILFLEQLYRALTIIRHIPYHR